MDILPSLPTVPLSEQHPREQGLKHDVKISLVTPIKAFQSNIQENKD
mgnify:CR=1 FL=1